MNEEISKGASNKKVRKKISAQEKKKSVNKLASK